MNETIHGMFEDIVNIFPDKIAVKYQDKKITYTDLNQKANQLGCYISKKSKTLITSNDKIKYLSIVVCLSPSIERIVSIIGALKAGYAYVPLDGDQPLERLNYIVNDTNAPIVITERKYLAHFLQINIDRNRIFCWEDDILELSKSSINNIKNSSSQNDLAYIIYTSGTTGQPKGVMIEHHSVINLVKNNIYFPVKTSDCLGHAANFSFDASTFEIWGALLNGASCHIIDKEILTDLSLFVELLEAKFISILFITTALLNSIIDYKPEAFSFLRLLYFGGELVNHNKINTLIKKYQNLPLDIIHVYGPTENTTFSLFHRIDKNRNYINTIPIGHSITGIEFTVVKHNQDTLIQNQEGELYLSGKGLAKGYLNQPELTSKKFITYDNKIFYKTGDWVKINDNGEIEYINRIDTQVKIRGFRVELEEIESLLNKSDLVKHSCVCYIKISEDNGMLVAFIIANNTSSLSQKNLNIYLKKSLPLYMIPQRYITLKYFPLTANGKIDKLKLCNDFKNEFFQKKTSAPVSHQAKAMVTAWQKILQLERIDQEDNFFEIGGHSLLAMKLANHIKTSHKLNCTIQDIFNYPVLSDFTKYINSKEMKARVNQSQKMLIGRYKAGDIFPLTSVQQRLWFLHYFTGKTTAHYNICFAFKIKGSLNTAYLAQTWEYLLKNHNILRMSIVNVNGEIKQVINSFETIMLKAEDIGHKALAETLTNKSLFHFDLSIYPLWRIKLYKILGFENEYVFFISIHHILCDGWSFALLINEFNRYYTILSQQLDQHVHTKTYQYSDYALWENKTKHSYSKELEYWKNKLKNYAQLMFCESKLYNSNIGHVGDHYYDLINENQLQEIKKFSLSHNATLFGFLLTCVSIVIYHHTLQNDFVIGIPIANRHQKKYEKIVGCFINTLPIRILIDDCSNIICLLKKISDTCLEAYENQAVPYEMIVDAVERTSNTRKDSLFNILCALQNAGDISLKLPDTACDIIDIQYKTSKFPLTFNFVEHNKKLKINIEYMTDIFNRGQIEGFVVLFKKVVAATLSNHLSLIKSIINSGLSNEIPVCTLRKNDNKCKSVIELFQTKVKEHGSQIAVKHGKHIITYKELDQMSNQLAHYIEEYYSLHMHRPIANNTLIALSIQPSLELIVTMLGILKTGASYLPIDPNYPFERKKYYVENSQSELVISSSRYMKGFELIGLPKYKLLNWDKVRKLLHKYETAPIRVVYDLAYVIYTSGSTGNPKGVVIQHINLVELFNACNTIFNFQSSDKWSLFHSFSFDFSIWEIWGALINGATLVIVPYQTARSPELFLKFLQREKISILNQTPSAFKRLLDIDSKRKTQLIHLRYIIFGGEALKMHYVEQWWKKYKENKPYLINMYGITEITVHATYLKLNKSHINSSGNGSPIGKMLRHLHSVVLDQNMHLVPMNEPGELYICGASVAKEYLNNQNLTEQRFIQYQNHRFYKTGDKVRLLTDGNLEYLGRIDNQVKLRGYRIELGEIEQILNKHPDIRESIVLLNNYTGQDQLIAFILLQKDISWEEKNYRLYLQQYLPDFMMPNQFLRIFSIPLTLNGKVDKEALFKNLGTLHSEKIVNDQGLLTPIENQLLTIWQSLFLDKKINIHDNFFSLGGDSITSIQLINRAKINGLNISIIELFSNPTIYELSKVVKIRNIKKNFLVKDVKGNVELTPIQNWFFNLKLMNQNHFNQSIILQSNKKWNKEILNTAINSVISYHDMFRARYKQPEKTAIQYLTDPKSKYMVNIYDINLDNIVLHEQDAYLKNEYDKLQQQINIVDGPICRIANVSGHYSNKEYLVVIIHHLIIDGVSWRIFIEDLNSSYDNLIKGKEPVFPEKTCSYQSWSKSLLNYCAKTKNEKLQNNNVLNKDDYFRSLYDSYKNQPTYRDCEKIELNLDWINASDIISSLYTLFEIKVSYVLLGGLLLAFNRWKNIENVFIDLESHGRENFIKQDVSRTIGWFTTIYPVHLSIIDNKHEPLMENVIYAAKKAIDDQNSNGFKYSLLRYLTPGYVPQDVNYCELPAVGFNFLGSFENLNSGETHFQLTLDTAGENISFENQLLHLIDVSALILNKNLKIFIYFSKKHFSQANINELSSLYKKTLEEMITYWQNKIVNESITNYKYFPLNQQDYSKLSHLGEIEDIYPLTSLQEGMLFHAISQENSSQYFTQVYWKLNHNIEESIYKKTWNAIINKYSILKSVFYWDNESQPFQLILSAIPMDWYHHDWSNISSKDQENELDSFLRNDRAKSFSLNHPPLLRFHWIKLSDNGRIFVFDHHHLLLDGWSLNIILSDIQKIYEQIQKDNYVLEEAASYRNYIDWYSKQDKNTVLKFWKPHLKDIESSTKLPFYNSSNTLENYISSSHIEQYYYQLNEHQKLKYLDFVKENNTTLNVLFQLAWSILLHKYTGQDSIIYGTVISGRSIYLPHIQNIVGMLINTVPIIVKFSSDIIIKQQLLDMHYLMGQVNEYNCVGLKDIQALSKLSSTEKLISHLFVFENYPNHLQDNSSTHFTEVSGYEQTNYPLCFIVGIENGITLKVIYDKDYILPSYVERLCVHFTAILNSMIVDANQLVKDIKYLQNNLHYDNKISIYAGYANYRDKTILDIFEDMVKKQPLAIAIIHENIHLTYQDLDQQSSALSIKINSRLKNNFDIDKSNFIAVCISSTLNFIISILAVLKSRCVYMPLSSEMPSLRISKIINQVECKLIITEKCCLSKFQSSAENCQIFEYEEYTNISTSQVDLFSLPLKQEKLAYLMYTSGSTGVPKGVMINQNSIVELVKNNGIIKIDKSSRMLQTADHAFDATTFEVWGTLLNGGTLVTLNKETLLDKVRFESYLTDNQITHLWLTSALLDYHVSLNPGVFKNLKYLIAGGEALNFATVKTIVQSNEKPMYFINGYGPTECTTFTTFHEITIKDIQYNSIPIGKPRNGVECFVLNKQYELLPSGIIGELYIAGNCLSAGYYKNPSLSDVKFFKNNIYPYLPNVIYKTGDYVCSLDDGSLIFLGRKDNQVKIRGYLVEINEIEEHLNKHPLISKAIVVTKKIETDIILHAFVKCVEKIAAREINDYLLISLPEYMLPNNYQFIDEFPLTNNGKIDRNILIKICDAALRKKNAKLPAESDDNYITALRKIWESILNKSGFNIQDRFFDAGGHSLLYLKLMTSINKYFNRHYPLSWCFRNNTIYDQANAIRADETLHSFKKIIEFQKGNNSIPLIFVHPGFGGVEVYQGLSQILSPTITFYGLESYNLFSGQMPIDNIEKLAECYINVLSSVLPGGKCVLGGWSLGGVIAYEMAQQLKQSNIEVVSVILLDSYIWTSNKELSHLNINSILEYILLKHASPNTKTIPEAISAEIRAIKSYYPTVPLLEREIVLLKAKRFNFDEINDQVNKADDFKNHLYQLFKDSSNGWKSIIKKLKIFNLDETHDNFLSENNIVHIAQIINQLMKDYEAKVTNSTENQFITNEVLQELC